MNIIFAGSKGKTGSVICSYLKENGYIINNEVNNAKAQAITKGVAEYFLFIQ